LRHATTSGTDARFSGCCAAVESQRPKPFGFSRTSAASLKQCPDTNRFLKLHLYSVTVVGDPDRQFAVKSLEPSQIGGPNETILRLRVVNRLLFDVLHSSYCPNEESRTRRESRFPESKPETGESQQEVREGATQSAEQDVQEQPEEDALPATGLLERHFR
jgi:hypothetical protein